jgi:hypothetical protein
MLYGVTALGDLLQWRVRRAALSSKFLPQCPGLQQADGVKPLDERLDQGDEVLGLLALALLLPQGGEAQGGAQFPPPGLPIVRHLG